jgi:hypothetical protein
VLSVGIFSLEGLPSARVEQGRGCRMQGPDDVLRRRHMLPGQPPARSRALSSSIGTNIGCHATTQRLENQGATAACSHLGLQVDTRVRGRRSRGADTSRGSESGCGPERGSKTRLQPRRLWHQSAGCSWAGLLLPLLCLCLPCTLQVNSEADLHWSPNSLTERCDVAWVAHCCCLTVELAVHQQILFS